MKTKESKTKGKRAGKLKDLPAKKRSKRTETAVKGGGTRKIVDVIFS